MVIGTTIIEKVYFKNTDVVDYISFKDIDDPSYERREYPTDDSLTQKHIETYKNGLLHSYDGEPACQISYGDLNSSIKKWYKNGKLHREDGPAHIIKHRKGTLLTAFCLEGARISKSRYLKMQKKRTRRFSAQTPPSAT